MGRNRLPVPPGDPASAARFRSLRGALERDDLKTDVDAVVHAAATSPWQGVRPGDIIRDNIDGTRRLLEAAAKARVGRFVFFSSLSAYGRIEEKTVDENTPSRQPDLYGLTKLVGERLVAEMLPRASALSVRLPGVVGRGAARHWLATTLAKLRAGAPVTYFNPRQPFNNLVHESDVATLVTGFLHGKRDPGHDAVVVASSSFLAVEEVVRRLVSMTASRSEVACNGVRPGSFTITFAKVQERYGFAPLDTEAALTRYVREELGQVGITQ